MIKRQTTKDILAASLIELSSGKSISKITVKDIVANCGTSTATFYRHFSDKYELIYWIFTHNTEEIYSDFLEDKLTWRETLLSVIKVMEEEKHFYINAFKYTSGADSILFYINEKSELILTEKIAKLTQEEISDQILFDIHFYQLGSASCGLDWFINKKPYSREQLVDFMITAMPEELKPYLLQEK